MTHLAVKESSIEIYKANLKKGFKDTERNIIRDRYDEEKNRINRRPVIGRRTYTNRVRQDRANDKD